MKELMVGAAVAAALGLYLGNLSQPKLTLEASAPMQAATAVLTNWNAGTVAPVDHAPDHVVRSEGLPHEHAIAVETHAAPMPTPDDIEWAYEERAFAESAAAPPEAPPIVPPSIGGDILAGTHAAEAPATPDPTPAV